jgi:hypothetical protein
MVDAIESEKEDLLVDFPSETNSDEEPLGQVRWRANQNQFVNSLKEHLLLVSNMSIGLSPSKKYINNPLLFDNNKGKVKVVDIHNVLSSTINMKAKRPYKNTTKHLDAP